MSQDTRRKFFELARKALEQPRESSCDESSSPNAAQEGGCCGTPQVPSGDNEAVVHAATR